MSTIYVKICPICGHENPENEIPDFLCRGFTPDGIQCFKYLGSVEPVQQRTASSVFEPQHQKLENSSSHPKDSMSTDPIQLTQADDNRKDSPISQSHTLHGRSCNNTERYDTHPLCYMSYIAGGGMARDFPVRADAICGRPNIAVPNQIALENIPGNNFIHSRHCHFSVLNGTWHVTPIVNQSYTNPTILNMELIPPGHRRPLKNGDVLTLSAVSFTIRIVNL